MSLPAALAEPGGVFTYTLTITNNSVESVTITSITDDNALPEEITSLIGTTMAPGQVITKSYTVERTEAGTYPNSASVTVRDNEDNTATDSDSETVAVTDVEPTVTIDKSVDKSTLPQPGGEFTLHCRHHEHESRARHLRAD